ncbi:hypothetical protein DL96DRAFT_1625554 [Flagelloscypha sp. PMI_526]|nr:hypothetical protein DL96DRAFT_1625554 [Flagelloscypha sp. PMI_526]
MSSPSLTQYTGILKYSTVKTIVRSLIRTFGMDIAPREFFPNEVFGSSSIPKSTSPTEPATPTSSILDTLYSSSSATSASASSTGDPNIEYQETQTPDGNKVGNNNTDKSKTHSNSDFGCPRHAVCVTGKWNPGTWEGIFARELKELDTGRSIMSLD